MVKEKEKQHYIPQFYLRKFSPREKQNYVYCFDKENGNSFITSVRDMCYEIGFYENQHKSKKPIEEAFSFAEKECSTLFRKVIDYEDLTILRVNEFSGLLVCLLIFKQRTKKRRDVISDARKKWMKRINDKFSDWRIVPKFDNWKQSDHLLSMIKTYKEELNMLCRNNWELIINKTRIPFWTSDDPLIQQFVTNDERFHNPYIKYYFPLTPKILMHSEPLFCTNIKLLKREITNEEVVNNLNLLTFNNAHRFVISKRDNFIP